MLFTKKPRPVPHFVVTKRDLYTESTLGFALFYGRDYLPRQALNAVGGVASNADERDAFRQAVNSWSASRRAMRRPLVMAFGCFSLTVERVR